MLLSDQKVVDRDKSLVPMILILLNVHNYYLKKVFQSMSQTSKKIQLCILLHHLRQ